MAEDRFDESVQRRGFQKTLKSRVEAPTSAALSKLLFGSDRAVGDTTAQAAFTFGDLLYDLAAIDPRVVAAADFLYQNDSAGPLSFSVFADEFHRLTGRAAQGAHAQLKGYVAEQTVASRLVELGHQVSFPDAPNQPGFDLLVDGAQFQVKCGENLSLLDDHFTKYPDIPVLANDELLALALDDRPDLADSLFAVDGFSMGRVEAILDDSIEAGSEVLDYEVALSSALVSAGRGLLSWWRNEVSLGDAIIDLGATFGTKTALGTLGSIGGKCAGVALFGPAGAVVFGGMLAVMAAGQSHRVVGRVRDLTNRSLARSTRLAADALVRATIGGLETKIAVLRDKHAQVPGDGPAADYIRGRFEDQIVYARERIAEARSFERESNDARGAALAAIDIARRSRVHAVWLQHAYRDLLRALEALQNSQRRWGLPLTGAWKGM